MSAKKIETYSETLANSKHTMTSVRVHSDLVLGLQELLLHSKHQMLIEIAEEFELDVEYLEKKYLKKHRETKSHLVEKTQYNKEIADKERCKARTRKGDRCIKSRIEGSTYCQIHMRWGGSNTCAHQDASAKGP